MFVTLALDEADGLFGLSEFSLDTLIKLGSREEFLEGKGR
jgi:hypothetical protein